MEYKLSDSVSLKFVESIKIDGIDYFKYCIDYIENESSNSKDVYFNE